jgi:tetratricopeptide (TPR) repeat protein
MSKSVEPSLVESQLNIRVPSETDRRFEAQLEKISTYGEDSLLEIGRLHYERCDFKRAETYYRRAEEIFYEQKNYPQYLTVVNRLLRIYAEMENEAGIDECKEKLQTLVLKEKVKLDARTYYTLGLCAAYKGQQKVALEYLEKSLAQALAQDDKESICYAVNGIALVYYYLGRFEDALKEIYNLQVFFQVMPLPELKITSQMLNGHILRRMGKHEQALDIFWKCYEELRDHKNLYLHLSLLLSFSNTYYDMGSKDMARMYALLAKKSADPDNVKFMLKKIDHQLEKLGANQTEEYDLVFDATSKSVKERAKGLIDFGNQFILLDLIRLFMREPGEVFSKEMIVEKIWRQSYDPRVHDNKLYVTIKRLRKMIEPDFGRPKYIFRAKNGYFLNKNVKVLIQK